MVGSNTAGNTTLALVQQLIYLFMVDGKVRASEGF
jgi:hypothetical protein